MSGVLRLGNTGAGTGRSTLRASAINEQTFTLPSAGGTILTTNFDSIGTITWNGSNINITNADLNVNSGTLFVDESTNRVGIGTTTPGSILSIQDGSNPALGLYTGTTLRAELEATVAQTTLTSYSNSPLVLKTGGSGEIEALNIDRFGNIGIKTSANGNLYSGGNDLVVGNGGATNQGLTIYTGTGNQGIIAFADGFNGAAEQYAGYLLYEHVDDRMTFATTGVERMRLDSSGRLGINLTPSGNSKLQVSGSMRFAGAGDASDSVNPVIYRVSGQDDLAFATATNERMRIDSSGRLLVGTSSGSQTLTVAGTEGQTLTSTSAFVVQKRSISHRYVNLSTTAVSMGEALSQNAGMIGVFITNKDGDQCTFMFTTGKESGIAHRYGLVSGSNANCSVSLATNVFTITGMGDGITYTLTMSIASISVAPTLKASSTATGNTDIAMCSIGAF